MRPYIFKIPAGAEDSQFFGEANVVYLSPRATVRVTVKNPDNEEAFELTPGGSARLSRFNELRISHDGTGTETFTLYVGMNTEARTAQVSGNIQPVGGSDNTANPPMVQGVVNPVRVTPPTRGSAEFYRQSISTALDTIVTPAANTNGVRVDFIGLKTYDSMSRLMFGASAPVSIADTAVNTLAILLVDPSYHNIHSISTTPLPVIIPAGNGIYALCSSTTESMVIVGFEIL